LSPRSFWNTYDPTWSADGSTIVFEFVHSCNFSCELNRDLYKINHDGTGFGPVTSSGFDEWHADFSPDSTRIVFSTDRGSTGFEVFGWEVYVMGADGSSPVNLTNTSEITEWEPAWSPDGQSLVYSSFTAIDGELFTVRPDGTGRVDTTINGSQPSWQPVLNESPDCSSVAATPSQLRPANKHFRRVILSGTTDPDGDAVTLAIDGVTQDEPVGRRPDALRVTRPDRVKLRAERDNRGDGRVYRIAFTASDRQGGECSGEATVEVRRKKHRPAVDSAPPSFDSFGS
jgi:hypothetical protein